MIEKNRNFLESFWCQKKNLFCQIFQNRYATTITAMWSHTWIGWFDCRHRPSPYRYRQSRPAASVCDRSLEPRSCQRVASRCALEFSWTCWFIAIVACLFACCFWLLIKATKVWFAVWLVVPLCCCFFLVATGNVVVLPKLGQTTFFLLIKKAFYPFFLMLSLLEFAKEFSERGGACSQRRLKIFHSGLCKNFVEFHGLCSCKKDFVRFIPKCTGNSLTLLRWLPAGLQYIGVQANVAQH